MTHRVAVQAATRRTHTTQHTATRPAASADRVTTSTGRRRLRAGRPPIPLAQRRQPSSRAALLVTAFGAFLAFLDSTIVNIAFAAFLVGSAMASSEVRAQADLAIHPDTSSPGFVGWHQSDHAREAGRIATREALPRIMELVQR
jgi:hypothetical protein